MGNNLSFSLNTKNTNKKINKIKDNLIEKLYNKIKFRYTEQKGL